MSNIYVPIDSSDLSKAIPEGEDIIYSSLCRGEGSFVSFDKKFYWDSHLLMTKKGLYFFVPLDARFSKKQIAKLDPKPEVFIPWHNVSNVVAIGDLGERGGFIAKKAVKFAEKAGKFSMIVVTGVETGADNDLFRSCTLFLKRDPNFETEETFIQRNKEIKQLIDPMRVSIRLEIAKNLYQKFDQNPKYKVKEFKEEFGYFSGIIFDLIKKDWKKGNAPGTSLV